MQAQETLETLETLETQEVQTVQENQEKLNLFWDTCHENTYNLFNRRVCRDTSDYHLYNPENIHQVLDILESNILPIEEPDNLHIDILNCMGLYYNFIKKQYNKAIYYYQKAINKGHLYAISNISKLYIYDQLDLVKAKKYIKLGINKNNINSYIDLGDINVIYNKFDIANTYYDKYLQLSTNTLEADKIVAIKYEVIKKYSKAQKHYMLAINNGCKYSPRNYSIMLINLKENEKINNNNTNVDIDVLDIEDTDIDKFLKLSIDRKHNYAMLSLARHYMNYMSTSEYISDHNSDQIIYKEVINLYEKMFTTITTSEDLKNMAFCFNYFNDIENAIKYCYSSIHKHKEEEEEINNDNNPSSNNDILVNNDSESININNNDNNTLLRDYENLEGLTQLDNQFPILLDENEEDVSDNMNEGVVNVDDEHEGL